MFHVEYLFDLDIADKALKELFEPSGLPFLFYKTQHETH